MTTIHAAPKGSTPTTGLLLSVTLVHGSETFALLAPREEIRRSLLETGGVGRFDLMIGSDPHIRHAIAQHVDRGLAPHSFRHVVVQEVEDGDVVRMQVVVRVVELPKPVADRQAQAVQRKKHVTLRGPIGRLPTALRVDLSTLVVGSVFRVADLELPAGVECVDPPTDTIVEVRALIAVTH